MIIKNIYYYYYYFIIECISNAELRILHMPASSKIHKILHQIHIHEPINLEYTNKKKNKIK